MASLCTFYTLSRDSGMKGLHSIAFYSLYSKTTMDSVVIRITLSMNTVISHSLLSSLCSRRGSRADAPTLFNLQ